MPVAQARYWLLTIPVVHHPDQPQLKDDLVYLKGQKERGGETGLLHWQVLAVFGKTVRLATVKRHFCPQAHCEPSRSEAANDYVWKDDTSVPGTRFEQGALPISRARKADWNRVYDDAIAGNFDNIPKDILIRHYSSLKRIRVDNSNPPIRPNITVECFWGESGIGKTRRAWHAAGSITDVYIKNPNTKWWDGYRGQKTVIIDEFTGRIDLSYLLIWLDRYPCNVEVKGFSTPLLAERFFITSNLPPNLWYPEATPAHQAALSRRMTIEHMVFPWVPPHERRSPSPNPLMTLTPNNPNPNPLRVSPPQSPNLILTPSTGIIPDNLFDIFN